MKERIASIANPMTKQITDLGAAAFLMMQAYKVVGKKGKAILFEISQDEEDQFDQLAMDYLSSEFHRFDSCLMSLKKIGEYFPKN